MSTYEARTRRITPIDALTLHPKGGRVMVIKLGGEDTAVPLPLCVRPAIVTDVLADPVAYEVSDYYYGFGNPAVATGLITYPLDENAVFSVDQRVVIITAGDTTYIIGAAAAATRILIKITGTLTGDGYPFTEWNPVTNAAVPDGETGYAKEYNSTSDNITNIRVWAEKHDDEWWFFYPIGSDCNG